MNYPAVEKIRSTLGRSANQEIPSRPSVLSARLPGSVAEEIEKLLAEIKKLSGEARRLDADGLPAALAELVQEHDIRRAALWSTPRLEKLQVADRLRALEVDVLPPGANSIELAQCDLGITEADFALPETGTIALLSSPQKPRAVSLLPRVHLAIISPEVLRPDLHQVLAEAKSSPYLVFITGPSRTADIELTVTLGVHGPKNLAVWVI